MPKGYTRMPNGQARIHRAVRFTQEEVNGINYLAQLFDLTFSEAVRVCVNEQIKDKQD